MVTRNVKLLICAAEAVLRDSGGPRQKASFDGLRNAIVQVKADAGMGLSDDERRIATALGLPLDAMHLINELEYAVLARSQGLPGSAEKLSKAKQAIRDALGVFGTGGNDGA